MSFMVAFEKVDCKSDTNPSTATRNRGDAAGFRRAQPNRASSVLALGSSEAHRMAALDPAKLESQDCVRDRDLIRPE